MLHLLKILAVALAPLVVLHPQEKYMPCTIDFFCCHSSLWLGDQCLIPEGSLKSTRLPLHKIQGRQWYLKINEKAFSGVSSEKLSEIPYYVYLFETEETYQFIYVFFYAYNGPIRFCGLSFLEVGNHEGDIEHVTIEVSKHILENQAKTDREIDPRKIVNRVYFSSHRKGNGVWLKPYQIEWRNHRLVTYSAIHTHASYPHAGTIWRCFGAVNDHTGNGLVWNPKHLVLITNKTHWVHYPGKIGGKKGIPAPYFQEWWNGECQKSSNWLLRLFCFI
jgi:hypothetical protein